MPPRCREGKTRSAEAGIHIARWTVLQQCDLAKCMFAVWYVPLRGLRLSNVTGLEESLPWQLPYETTDTTRPTSNLTSLLHQMHGQSHKSLLTQPRSVMMQYCRQLSV